MLTPDTKRHIDAARQVLVGVVPNPTSQIDQITNALIYKFMDDMDQAAIKAGDEPSFFVGDLERYAWSRLMDSRLGNQEKMNLYGEALIKFSESKKLPDLFKEIFRQAYLPYRQPEVLGLFLHEINFFDYSHPEELGNAYEYLLSIMSSQGDAGQFRTPRHIIDFIVEVVDPSKDDKVLDPACGTGGFLVSAYKHIASKHDGKNIDGTPNGEKSLTPDDRRKLMQNFEGYDVDPGMVRIAQVNMYLHQFKNPKIYNYNTLSSEERWNDKFDVMLANPPFMSPKGGVETHSKFSVQSSRSEVLFVDYIMNHLRPKGRAGIIVPEGVIFQSGVAYKQLRKNLVEDGLFAVVSLPSGVFNPYAGVKTSILLFDAEMGRQQKEILFVKIENDGFDLGAQRREKAGSNLPEAARVLFAWRNGEKIESKLAQWVSREKISETGDYNLSGDRYRVAVDYSNAKWPMVELGEVADIIKGSAITKKTTIDGNIPVIAGGQEPAYYHNESNRSGEIITVSASGAYAGFVNYFEVPIFASDCSTVQTKDANVVTTKYLFNILKAKQEDIYSFQQGGAQPHVYPKDLKTIQIPLPPLEIQEQIVAELDGYQNLIAGARKITTSWKPHIDIDPEWEKVKLGEICDPEYGFTDTARDSGEVRFVRITDISSSGELLSVNKKYVELTEESKKSLLKKGDLLVARTGATFGKTLIFQNDEPSVFASFLIRLRFPSERMIPEYYWSFAQSDLYWKQANQLMTGGAQPQFNGGALKQIEIPLPPLNVQKEIVERIKHEHTLVESAKTLIEIYEQKTREVIERLWNE
jgi:type I restriction enzyme M protein